MKVLVRKGTLCQSWGGSISISNYERIGESLALTVGPLDVDKSWRDGYHDAKVEVLGGGSREQGSGLFYHSAGEEFVRNVLLVKRVLEAKRGII